MRKLLSLFICALALPLLWDCTGDVITISDIDPDPDATLNDPRLSWSQAEALAVLGQANEFPTLSNLKKVDVSYLSSNEEVATVDGKGQVTPVAAGTTVITAFSERDDRFLASSCSYTLTVVRAGAGLGWSAAEATAVMGNDNEYPSLSNPNKLEVAFTSSDEGVATVEAAEAGCRLTLVSAGIAVITASSPQTDIYEAAEVSYTLTVERADGQLAWSEEEALAVMGEDNIFPALLNPNRLEVTFSSSDSNVASVTATADGCKVTPLHEGVTVITASSPESRIFNASSASYTLTVRKSDVAISWSEEECTATINADNSFPALINPGGQKISYSSSDAKVATVSATADGYAVNLLSKGVVTVTATAEETDIYNSSSCSYTLNVELAEPRLAWSSTSATAVMGEDNRFPTLSNPDKLEVSFSSSDSNVASVTPTSNGCKVTLRHEGVTVITASSKETGRFKAATASYTLTVSKSSVFISWSDASCTATLGSDSNVFPTLSNPGKQQIEYSSSDGTVAAVVATETGCSVTLKSQGTTTIKATSVATDTYASTTASYTLNVVKADGGLEWSKANYSATIGAQNNSFPKLKNPNNLEVTYSSSDESVATVSATASGYTVTLKKAGETTITASSKETDIFNASSASYTLTVQKSTANVTISWSTKEYTATLASSSNVYPTLNNPGRLAVEYSSSNEAVATVSQSGNSYTVTLKKEGLTVIYAKTKATDDDPAQTVSYNLNVVKNTVHLEWSSASCNAILENGSANRFPTLSVSPGGLSISYTSSETNVATVSSSGAVTLKGTGTTDITASFGGNTNYQSASATYTLTVTSDPGSGGGGGDDGQDGEVTTVFASSGGGSSDDEISNTTFTRLVTVTYASGGASVTGYSSTSGDFTVSISGNKVTITYSGSENVAYKLKGSASDGYFKLYSSKKQAIWLSNVNLTCSSGAAINNQSGKRTFVYVEGTNALADGSSASYSSGSEDMKAVFFSEGQLVFSGRGTLTVTANNSKGKSGIVSDDYIRFLSKPTVKVIANSGAGHGIKVNEYVQINAGTISITSKAATKKGISSDNYVLVEGGSTTINVSGGVGTEDGEYKGSAGIKADNYFEMNSGTLTITNTGTGGKGISAGDYDYSSSHNVADSYISGGTLKITTSGAESNGETSKGIKVGWVTKNGNKVTASAGNLVINGGIITVSSSKSEGIEAKGELTFDGGETYSTSAADDAINCQGDMIIKSGYIYAFSSKNDAMDANGDMKISGGYVYAVTTKGSPEVALDANTEEGHKLYINNGATIVSYGGLERGYSSSQNIYQINATQNSWTGLFNGTTPIAAFQATSGASQYVVTAPSLDKAFNGVSVNNSGKRCSGMWATSGISGGTETTLSTYTGGSGGWPH